MQITVLVADIAEIVKLPLIHEHLHIGVGLNKFHPSVHGTDNTCIQSRNRVRNRLRRRSQFNTPRKTLLHRLQPNIASIPCIHSCIAENTGQKEQGKYFFTQYIGL